MTEPLATLVAPCSHSVDIKKSRFLAQAVAVNTPEDALAFLDSTRSNGGGHHCWAWRIGQSYRFNDDGEPAGSAGKPILAAIDGQGLDRVMVVVTRWFGGIKLGIGGLVRAYGGSAAECLRLGEKETIVASTRMTLACDYADWPLLKNRLESMRVVVGEEAFGAHGIHATLDVPDEQVSALRDLIADATRGQGQLV